MANYMFRRDDNPAGFLATRRLGTDVLNALGALRASGHAIEFDPESIVEREDEHGEIVMLEVHGHPLKNNTNPEQETTLTP